MPRFGQSLTEILTLPGRSPVVPCQPGQGTADTENPGEKQDQRDPKHERPDRSQQDVKPKIFAAEPVRENRQGDKQHCQHPA